MRGAVTVMVALSVMMLGLAPRTARGQCPEGQCMGADTTCISGALCGRPDSGSVELTMAHTFDVGLFFNRPVSTMRMGFAAENGATAPAGAFLELGIGRSPTRVFRISRRDLGWVVSLEPGIAGRTPRFTVALKRGTVAVPATGWGTAQGIARLSVLPARVRVSTGKTGLRLTWEFSEPTAIDPLGGRPGAGITADALEISIPASAPRALTALHFSGGQLGGVVFAGPHVVRTSAVAAAGSRATGR